MAMRRWIWIVVLALAACRPIGKKQRGAEARIRPDAATVAAATVSAPPPELLLVDPTIYDHPHTSELGTHRTRGMSKTIEWQAIGTEEGATYMGGAVGVDRILRHDADNFFGVRVRLAARKNQAIPVEWRVAFYAADGLRLIGFNQLDEKDDGWRRAVLPPFGFAEVTDSCRVKGAIGFRLFVRAPGSKDEGVRDGFSGEAAESLEKLRRYR